MNTTCPTTAYNGTWTYHRERCSGVNPATRLKTCSDCVGAEVGPPGLGWCPTTRQCLMKNASSMRPYGDVTCLPDRNLGTFTSDCSCTRPYTISDPDACVRCDGFNWCTVASRCKAAMSPEDKPCPPSTCHSNCACLPESNPQTSNCTVCKPGFYDPSSNCVQSCSPNCFDCHPKNSSLCFTQCRRGFTNFPYCDKVCPSHCISCGGAHANSTVPSSQCTVCADLGAAPPNCKKCAPYVCRDAAGLCEVPCNNPNGTTPLPPAAFNELKEVLKLGEDQCEECQEKVKAIKGVSEGLYKLLTAEERMELVIADLGLACLDLGIYSVQLAAVCGAVDGALEIGDVAAYLLTYTSQVLLEELGSLDLCIAMHQCSKPRPCSPSRSAIVEQRSLSPPYVIP